MSRFTSKLLPVIALFATLQATATEAVVSGEFDLVDHTGQAVNESSYDGKIRLVFFGFTQCPDVCPTTLVEVSHALRQLGDAATEVQPLFISVDLKNDTRERLAAYVSAFHSSIVGLTGSDAQISAAADAFNVTYGVDSVNGRAEVFHSAYLFLMGRQGEFVDVFGYGTRAPIIADTIRRHLQIEPRE
jgi:protein SCO1/2